MKINLIYFLICGSILLGSSEEVIVSSNSFSPNHLEIDIGETVTWTRTGGFHNVDGSTDTYPDNPDSFFSGSASSSWSSFSHIFTVAGEYNYECNPHASMGMKGTITVSAADIYGCTDSEACNYDDTANVDDGSCEYCLCQTCSENGTCLDNGSNYTCTCNSFYTGTNCETDIDECLTDNGGCGDATCVNNNGAAPTCSSLSRLSHGPIVGNVTSSSATFVLRTDQSANVKCELSTSANFSSSIFTDNINTEIDNDFFGKVNISDLSYDTQYYYRPVIDETPVDDGLERYFRTFPEEGSVGEFTFLSGSCQQANDDPFSNIGTLFSIIASQENPAFFLHQGDWGYPDTTDDNGGPYFAEDFANVQASYRAKYINTYPMNDLFRIAPIDYVYDDHDMVNNNSDRTFPGIANSIKGYNDYFPHYPLASESNGLWHKFSYGNAEIFVIDNRSQRDPNLSAFTILENNYVEFTPPSGHTILGEEQMNWLLTELTSSTAKWKFISTGTSFNPANRLAMELAVLLQSVLPGVVTPQGYVTPTEVAVNTADAWAGFPEDITQIIDHVISNSIENIIFLSGDSHSSGLDDGNSSIFPELMAGPMDRVNSAQVALQEQFGTPVWNEGGHTSNIELGNAYGRITVFGSDSVKLEAVAESGETIGSMLVEDGYIPPAVNAAIGPIGINFGTIEPGSGGMQAFIILSTSVDPLIVTDIQTPENFSLMGGFPTTFEVPSGGKKVVPVFFSPSSAGTFSGSIIVTTNAPKQPQVTIQVVGIAQTFGCTDSNATNYNPDATADDGSCITLNIINNFIPTEYTLMQAYPNPFNPVTSISYGLPEYTNVQINIFDLSGKQVESLVNEFQEVGYHSVLWNADAYSSGVYFVKMIVGEYVSTQKLMLVK